MKNYIYLIATLLIVVVIYLGVNYKNNEEYTVEKIEVPSEVSSPTIYLKNLDTDEILIRIKGNQRVRIASLTKLITAYILLTESSNMEETVSIKQENLDKAFIEGASIAGIRSNDKIKVIDLAYAIVLPSGAEATLAAADFISGSEKTFVKKMNTLAKKIGMKNTKFINATGLDEGDSYSTVNDLAKFMSYALKDDNFYQLVTTLNYQIPPTPESIDGYPVASTLLVDDTGLSFSNGAILGGKTGYTQEAGQCLISISEVGGQRYLLITTGADGDPSTSPVHIEDAKLILESIPS